MLHFIMAGVVVCQEDGIPAPSGWSTRGQRISFAGSFRERNLSDRSRPNRFVVTYLYFRGAGAGERNGPALVTKEI